MTYHSYNPNGLKVERWEDLVDDGWKGIMRALQKGHDFRVLHKDMEPVTLTQVKEKFGSLRIYYNGGDDVFRDFIRFADLVSGNTCEVCGKVGSVTDIGGYLKAVCEDHETTDTD